ATAEESMDAENNADEPETAPQGENVGLTVAVPLGMVLCGNLTKLLEAKGSLIKKALGINDLRIEIDGEKVSFPWFSEAPEADAAKAYTHFISALCEMSRNQKRITATEKKVENEKYAFRCFLLRLGFIGKEYKDERKILLKNLSGSSAFKNGERKEAAGDELSE
ncbi:MAG: virulence protein, partial [Lachnospiraceae bacterium]|nr:virulence protein [Lachnospiraceae bacterium]